MKDKEFEKFRKKFKNIVEHWVNQLDLEHYKLDILYKSGENTSMGDKGGSCAAYINILWPYISADLYIYPEECTNLSDRGLEQLVVHELSHLFLAPIQSKDTDTEKLEFATESLSRVFYRKFDKLYEYKKK